MLFIIILVILGFIVMYSGGESFSDGLLGALIGFLTGLLLMFTIGQIIGLMLPKEENITKENIYALNSSDSTEGASFIFSGYVDENFIYRYVIETDKGKHVEEIDADKVYIVEGNYEPIMEIHKTVFKYKWMYLFAYHGSEKDYVKFYVPSGTVTTEYSVNLE